MTANLRDTNFVWNGVDPNDIPVSVYSVDTNLPRSRSSLFPKYPSLFRNTPDLAQIVRITQAPQTCPLR